MNRTGPIILVEDDEDDRDMFQLAYEKLSLSNELVLLPNAIAAFEYICRPDVQPFIIVSDINMPKMSGFELCDKLFENPELRKKAIPFVFLTTSDETSSVARAYKYPIQGIFSKPNTVSGYQKKIRTMIDYWEASMLL